MGIEYFIKDKYFPNELPIRIGIDTSSAWCFGLCVYDKYVIHSLDDWIPIFSHNSRIIVDQFNCLYMPDLMIKRITKRGFKTPIPPEKFDYTAHNVELGPNNLVRRKIGHHNCIAHGEGTWDYVVIDT